MNDEAGMNNEGTKEQSFGRVVPAWKRVQVPAEVERVATAVVDSAFAVHQELGPRLLEPRTADCAR